jgi:hypothetical protein
MSWIATGVSVLGTGLGIYQGISGEVKSNRAKKDLEKLANNSPIYKPDKSIHDYYQEALNRYNQNPYQSAFYTAGQKNIQRGTASALNNLQGRGSAIAGAGRVALGQDTAMTNLGVQSEAQKNAKFGQLGQAAQANTAENYKAFDINNMTPYKTKLGLKEMELSAANEQAASGWQNAASGVSNVGALGAKGMYKK